MILFYIYILQILLVLTLLVLKISYDDRVGNENLTLMILRLILWCSGLSCCLHGQHPMWTPVHVSAVPLWIQLPANEQGKEVEDG